MSESPVVNHQSNFKAEHKYEFYSPPRDQIRHEIDVFLEESRYSEGSKTSNFSPVDRSIEESLWILEASLNDYFSHAITEYEEGYESFTTINVPMSLTDPSLVSGYSLVNAYNILLAGIQSNVSVSDIVELIDITYQSQNGNSVTFGVTTFMSKPVPLAPGADLPGLNDYWKMGDKMGQCNGISGGYPVDLRQRLSNMVNHNITNNFVNKYNNYVAPGPITWTGIIVYAPTVGSPNIPNNPAVNENYKIPGHRMDPFPSATPNNVSTHPVEHCFTPSELDTYRNEVWNIINNQFPLVVGGNYLDVKAVNLVQATYLDVSGPEARHFAAHHVDQVIYGYPIY
ncbi:MAG: hypothetical protein SchgKO_25660 [Schleiferiaceae bacterium]